MLTLTPVADKFISCWGEMGVRWGVNRSVAQLHALFFLAPGPLNAEEAAAALGIARSNVSAGLRELESWGLIKQVGVRGDRRQHFEGGKDVWEMFRIILEERKRREVDPTILTLRECLAEAQHRTPGDAYTIHRFQEALEFFDVVIPLYNELRKFPGGRMRRLLKVKSGARAFFGRVKGVTVNGVT